MEASKAFDLASYKKVESSRRAAVNIELPLASLTVTMHMTLLNACIQGFDSQPEGLGVAFFATGPGLGLIMYIFTTLEFPTYKLINVCSLLSMSFKGVRKYLCWPVARENLIFLQSLLDLYKFDPYTRYLVCGICRQSYFIL